MPLDKFGRSNSTTDRKQVANIHSVMQFSYTEEGDVNFGNRKLRNVKLPSSSNDCATKKYTDDLLMKITKKEIDGIKGEFDRQLNEVRYALGNYNERTIQSETSTANQLTEIRASMLASDERINKLIKRIEEPSRYKRINPTQVDVQIPKN